MAKSKSAAIRDYLDPLAPHKKRRRIAVAFMAVGLAMCLTSAFLSLAAHTESFRYSLLIGGFVVFFASALVLVNTILYDHYGIKFLRERMASRLEALKLQAENLVRQNTAARPDSPPATICVIGGFSFDPYENVLATPEDPTSEVATTAQEASSQEASADAALNLDARLIRPEQQKGFLASAYEVFAFILRGDELAILSNRSLLHSVSAGRSDSQVFKLASLKHITKKEELRTAKPGGKRQAGLFRYLELETHQGERLVASLSYFDPIDERREPSFADELATLQALVPTNEGSERPPH